MIGNDKQVEHALEEKARLLDLSNDAILVRDASDRIHSGIKVRQISTGSAGKKPSDE